MKFLISGGTGLIGKRLTEYLIDRGHSVNILTRNKSLKSLKDIKKFYFWDPSNFKIDTNCIENVDVIINLAGKNIFSFWSEKTKKEIIESRLNSVTTLNKLLKENDNTVKHFISSSATGIYANNINEIQDEYSETKSHSFLANVVEKWEKKVEELSELNILVSKVRIGIVLSVNGGFLEKQILFNNIRFRPLINGGKQNISWIHIDDVVRIFYFLVENSLGGVYNATSPYFSTNLELTDKIEKLGKKYLINISTPLLFASIPFKILGIGDFFNEVVMFNSKVIPKKLLDKGFVFKFESLKKIMTF
tara:strand:- start:5830 stop:6744 length:915 start_codon:yes stop_codon:yes gene_type:complete